MFKKKKDEYNEPISLGLDDYNQSKFDEENMPPELPADALLNPKNKYVTSLDTFEENSNENFFDYYFEKNSSQHPEDIDLAYSEENSGEGFYQEGSKIKPPSRFPWVRWWKRLTEKQQILAVFAALTVAFLGLCVGIIMIASAPEEKHELVTKTTKKTYELGDEVKIKDFTFINKKETDEEILDTVSVYSTLFTDSSKYSYNSSTGVVKTKDKKYLDVGTYSVTISYKLDGVSKEKDITIKVKDTTKPKFKVFQNRLYVLQGMSGVDFREYFKVTDFSGTAKITCDDSKVNLQNVGTYNMTVKAEDASGNTVKKKCKVHVISIQDVKNGKVLSKLADGTTPSDATTAVNNSIQEDKNNEIASIQNAATSAYNTWQSYLSQANSVQSQINQLQNKKTTEQANLDSLKQKVDYAQEKLDEAESSGSDTSVIDSWKEQLSYAQKNYTTYSGKVTDSSKIDEEVSKLNKQLAELQKKASDAESNYNELSQSLEQAKAS